MKNFYTNVRTNKPELLPEFWSVRSLVRVSHNGDFSLLLPRIAPAMLETSTRICDNVVYLYILDSKALPILDVLFFLLWNPGKVRRQPSTRWGIEIIRNYTTGKISFSSFIRAAKYKAYKKNIEKRTDIYTPTLRSSMEGMGGKLDIIARFSEDEVRINNFSGI